MKKQTDFSTYSFTWILDNDFSKYHPITQVYGICFDEKDEILIIKKPDGDMWKVPGGRPEEGETWEQVLKRELMEEATVSVKNCKPLGLMKVIYPNNPNTKEGDIFYQARLICDIDEVLTNTKDPDNGLLHDRKFVPNSEITNWVQWGEAGDKMFADAISLHKES
ncbi:MAG: NUDIX hydrolase [Candidatus Roizmanbacteria bacterium]